MAFYSPFKLAVLCALFHAGHTMAWNNGHGYSCGDYTTHGWCCGHGACPGQEWTLGATYKYPENNCDACRRESYALAPKAVPFPIRLYGRTTRNAGHDLADKITPNIGNGDDKSDSDCTCVESSSWDGYSCHYIKNCPNSFWDVGICFFSKGLPCAH